MRICALVTFLAILGWSPVPSDATFRFEQWLEDWRKFLKEWDPAPNKTLLLHNSDPSSEEEYVEHFADLANQRELLRSIGDRDDIRDVHLYYFPDYLNPDYHEEILLGQSNQSLTNWNSSAPTKILVHGFIQNINATYPQNVKNAYLKRIKNTGQHTNILVLDWGRLAYQVQDGLPFYGRAVGNVQKVGDRLGQYILDLRSRSLLAPSLSTLHLVGQSLGAHVVGQAGSWIQNQPKNGQNPVINGVEVDDVISDDGPLMVGRITGCDPAGPLFYSGLAGRQLATGDATFVDVIHTNPGRFGMDTKILGLGTVETWVNWEPLTHIQPQCLEPGRVLREGEGWEMCSHNYCPKFFAWSIINNFGHQVVLEDARKCEKLDIHPRECNGHFARFGEDISLGERGKFFIYIRKNLDNMTLFMP